jgi:hypothetical protein
MPTLCEEFYGFCVGYVRGRRLHLADASVYLCVLDGMMGNVSGGFK